jgi:translocation and assembly module TamB
VLHDVAVGPGPVVQQIGGLFEAKLGLVTLSKEQRVPVWMENGRVYHNKMALTVNGYTVVTSGSVGTDGTLKMVAEVPIPDSAVGPLLKNNPRLREAIAAKRVNVNLGGTVNKPTLDPGAFRTAVRQFTEEVGKEALRGAVQKEAGKLFEKLVPKPPEKKD